MKKNKVIVSLILLATLVLAGSYLWQVDKAEELGGNSTALRLPIDIWPANFWIIVAEEKGFFAEEGIEPILVDVSEDYIQSIEDFVVGDILDTQNMSVYDLVEKNAQGANLVAVIVSDSSQGAEGIVAKKGIESISDLKDKRIGVEVGSYLDYMLETAMANAGINPKEYTKVNVITDEIREEFSEQDLDAAFMWEPNLTQTATLHDGHIIFDTSDLPGISLGVYVFKKEFMEARPELVQGFVNIWKKTGEYMRDNMDEVNKIVAGIDFEDDPGVYYTTEEVEELVEGDKLFGLEENLKAFSFNSGFESIHGNTQYAARFIQKNRNLTEMLNTNEMLNDYFIRNLSK